MSNRIISTSFESVNKMYIKLTRLDDSPIWLNAAFIVTIEPRRQGGSIVVPIGDGLDYEVKESSEDVLAMLGSAPVATVVPVPPPKEFAKKPESDVDKVKEDVETEEPEKPKKRTARKTVSRKSKSKKEPPVLDDEQVERLHKMAPGNLKKLANTLITQFKVSDVQAVVELLAERKYALLDGVRLVWTSPESDIKTEA